MTGGRRTICAAATCASTDAGGPVLGTALGIEADGALLIETKAGVRRRVIAGDVSVRSA